MIENDNPEPEPTGAIFLTGSNRPSLSPTKTAPVIGVRTIPEHNFQMRKTKNNKTEFVFIRVTKHQDFPLFLLDELYLYRRKYVIIFVSSWTTCWPAEKIKHNYNV